MNYLKKLLPLALVVALVAALFAGCGKNETPAEVEQPSSEVSTESSVEESEDEAPVSSAAEEEEVSEDSEQGESVEPSGHSMSERIEGLQQQLEGLEENQYEGLEFTAAIIERKAILSGGSMNVHVTISNNGEETVMFQQGSSDAEVPDALYVYADGLQTIIPQGNLGPQNMMMAYITLEPGDSVTYVYPLMAVEPNDNFDDYTLEIYGDSEEEYIGSMDPEALQERFPDIVLAAPGNYDGHAVLTYHLANEENPTGNPTGYAVADFTVTVNG